VLATKRTGQTTGVWFSFTKAGRLGVGDGALGFWKAVREVFPATREQRCWFHKQAMSLPHSRNQQPRRSGGDQGDL
jgi:hypothetical protein